MSGSTRCWFIISCPVTAGFRFTGHNLTEKKQDFLIEAAVIAFGTLFEPAP
jgi:predicted cupin superfamily sugar epimerase